LFIQSGPYFVKVELTIVDFDIALLLW
jgi:hypothetical protein